MTDKVDRLADLRLWPHRLTALIVVAVISVRAQDHVMYDLWSNLGFGVLPYVALEGVGRIPSGRATKLLFLAGALLVCAGAALYAPSLFGGSGEWAGVMYVYVPLLQVIGVAFLAVLLAMFRLGSALLAR